MRFAQLRQIIVTAFIVFFDVQPALALDLPLRAGQVPTTTNGVPHVQLGVEPVPAIFDELRRRVEAHPDIQIHPTIVSLPGALGFWIVKGIPLERQDVIVRGREFAHLHPDGSLHASLSPALAAKAVRYGWAVPHPWANQRPGWEGFVMIYTPRTTEELDVVFQLIVAGYEFIRTGVSKAGSEAVRPAVTRNTAPPQDPTLICSTC